MDAFSSCHPTTKSARKPRLRNSLPKAALTISAPPTVRLGSTIAMSGFDLLLGWTASDRLNWVSGAGSTASSSISKFESFQAAWSSLWDEVSTAPILLTHTLTKYGVIPVAVIEVGIGPRPCVASLRDTSWGRSLVIYA
jgi:hypothetical protein